jgi:hypothetical protein
MGARVKQEHVIREGRPTYCVSTVQLAVEHPGGRWFETYVFPSNGRTITDWLEVWGERFVTEDEASARHTEVVAALRAGTLLDHNGDPL